MTGLVHPSIDDIDCEILAELQANARIAFAELGRRVGLSTPAVIERVHRLEESQVILGYRTLIDPAKVGLPVRAFVHVTVAGDKLAKFAAVVRNLPEVLECHRVTGAESFIVQVAVRDVRHMEEVIDSMMPYVSTNTSMVLASPVPWNSILPAARYGKKPRPRKASELAQLVHCLPYLRMARMRSVITGGVIARIAFLMRIVVLTLFMPGRS